MELDNAINLLLSFDMFMSFRMGMRALKAFTMASDGVTIGFIIYLCFEKMASKSQVWLIALSKRMCVQ